MSQQKQRHWVRVLIRILRHQPERIGIALDPEGFANIIELHAAISRSLPGAQWLTSQRLHFLLSQQPDRFETSAGRVRARYGHTLPGVRPGRESPPPVILFHGTSASTWEEIRIVGLRPIREFVHLASDADYAWRIACSHSFEPVLIEVDAAGAARNEIRFRETGATVWLSEAIPPKWLSLAANRTCEVQHDLLEQRLASVAIEQAPESHKDRRRWYHVCSICNAACFAMVQSLRCPRCGARSHARERLVPPWERWSSQS